MDSANTSNSTCKPLSTRDFSDLSQTSVETTTLDGETKRRLPPGKTPVGLAKSPDLKNCKSKIGSLNNIKHTPAGGRVTIQTQKLKWSAKSKVGSLENKEHKPKGGNVKVETKKLEWNTTSRVQSLGNIKHKPGGGNVKIFNDTYRDKSTTPDCVKNQEQIIEEEAQPTANCNKLQTTTTITRTSINKRPASAAVVARATKPRDAMDKLNKDVRKLQLKDT